MRKKFQPFVFLFLGISLSTGWAQETGEHRGPPAWVKAAQAGGDYKGPRPPENASPEERRAFWQARAAERAKAEQGQGAAPSGQPMPPKAGGRGGADAGGARAPTTLSGPSAAPSTAGGDAARYRGRGDGVLWLSDLPPRREGRPGAGRPTTGMGGMSAMGDMGGMGGNRNEGTPMRRFWLRSGANPLTARQVPATESAWVQGPDMMPMEFPVEAHGGPYNINVPMPDVGYYNIYLVQKTLDQDQLNVVIAKAESPRSEGHSSPDNIEMLMMPRIDGRVPVEIVRERKDKEKFFTRINYGDPVTFQVLRDGKPVQNARVTLTTGQGWSNTQQSDEEGRTTFILIRDYYPQDWDDFEKGHRETYVVSASFTTEEKGNFEGGTYQRTRYTTSLSGAYYPSTSDYKSYAYGLLIGVSVLLFSGSAVYLYRRRRVKPYQEVDFDA